MVHAERKPCPCSSLKSTSRASTAWRRWPSMSDGRSPYRPKCCCCRRLVAGPSLTRMPRRRRQAPMPRSDEVEVLVQIQVGEGDAAQRQAWAKLWELLLHDDS